MGARWLKRSAPRESTLLISGLLGALWAVDRPSVRALVSLPGLYGILVWGLLTGVVQGIALSLSTTGYHLRIPPTG